MNRPLGIEATADPDAVKCLVPLTALLAGCVFGGGPLVGYGERGWFAGAEVSAGGAIIIPQATLGYHSDRHVIYLRADEAVDRTAMQRPSSNRDVEYGTSTGGGRIGAGVGLSMMNDDANPIGVFAAGTSIGHAIQPLNAGPSGNGCDVANTVGVVELQLRYAAGWSVVLIPRVERGTTFCN